MNPTNIINEWVKNVTRNRFTELMTLPISTNLISLMANVVYFKGSWEIPFDPDYTQPGLFYKNENEKVGIGRIFPQHCLSPSPKNFSLI